jgi:chromate transporter
VASIFDGLKAAIMAIVVTAVIKIGRKALKNSVMASMAAVSFVLIYVFKTPFPFIVMAAGTIGLVGGHFKPDIFNVIKGKEGLDGELGFVRICENPMACHIQPSTPRSGLIIAVFVLLWGLPMMGLYVLNTYPVFFNEALFFTKAAFLTFGGAYAVLAYIAQAGVHQYAWLTGNQMMDGLGLAETTPDPLIMVVQFVGFMAGWNFSGTLHPFSAVLVGSLVATNFTFLPCFLFIFLGGPYIEKFRDNAKLSAALSCITAAVVGVVLNLAVWFGLQVLRPAPAEINWFAAVIGLGAFATIQGLKVGVIPVISAAGVIGYLRHAAM